MRVPWLVFGLALFGGARAAVAQEADGKTVYEANCRRCHGARGTPPQTMLKQMPKIRTFDSAFVSRVTDDSLLTVIKKGKGEDMKSFAAKLNPAEMAAVIRYIRTLALAPRPSHP